MRLIYQGAHDAVLVPLPGGGETVVKRDEMLDTTDTHGTSLLEQPDNWRLVDKPDKPTDTKGEMTDVAA